VNKRRFFPTMPNHDELYELSPEARGIVYRWVNNWSRRTMNIPDSDPADNWRRNGAAQMLTELAIELEQHDKHDGWSGCELGPPQRINLK
jgi:hypothetical protein